MPGRLFFFFFFSLLLAMYKAAAPREKVQLGKLDTTLAKRGGHEDSTQLAVPRARPSFDKLSPLSTRLFSSMAIPPFFILSF